MDETTHVTALTVGWVQLTMPDADPGFLMEVVYMTAFAVKGYTNPSISPAERLLGLILVIDAAKRHGLAPTKAAVAMNHHKNTMEGWFRDRGDDVNVELAHIRANPALKTLGATAEGVLVGLNDLYGMLIDLNQFNDG